MRRSLVVCSIGLLGLASSARADFTNWYVHQETPLFVNETASAPATTGPNDRCVAFGITDFVTAAHGAEVWCTQSGALTQVNRIDTFDFASVAMATTPTSIGAVSAPHYAISDPGALTVHYGEAGQPPVVAVSNNQARSLGLAHFADGTPFLVYRGFGNVLYFSTRKPTGEWGETQLTNNSNGSATWSVDIAIASDVVHIAYWDDTYQAVRYARKSGATWIFETVKNLPSPGTPGSGYVSPSIAADNSGPYIAYAGRDGKVHYFIRNLTTWTERTYTPPAPPSTDYDQGRIGLAVDATRRAHFLFATGNGSSPRVLRYVSSPFAINAFQNATVVDNLGTGNPEGYRSIDMVLRGDSDQRLIASWASTLVNFLYTGCTDCTP